MEQINVDELAKALYQLFYSVPQIDNIKIEQFINVFSQIDISSIKDSLKESGEKWGNYGWIPNIPSKDNGQWIALMDYVPHDQTDADEKMQKILTNEIVGFLKNKIEVYIDNYNMNKRTFAEAFSCYEQNLFTSCCLNLFSMIDEVFLKFQSIYSKERRKLAGKAINFFKDSSPEDKNLEYAVAVTTMVLNLFSYGDDFKDIDKSLNRNYLSHGMNSYFPCELDCLKLFVLLYNIYYLFDCGTFVAMK